MPVTSATIRSMHWSDVQRVAALEQQLFPVDAWSPEAFWAELALVPHTRCYIVAVDSDERIVGYAGLFNAGSDADIQTVAVAPDAQGRGIGRLLLRSLLDTARSRGSSRVFLEVRSDNASAIAMYLAHGFEQLNVRRDYYAQGVDAVVMRLMVKHE